MGRRGVWAVWYHLTEVRRPLWPQVIGIRHIWRPRIVLVDQLGALHWEPETALVILSSGESSR